MNQEIVTVLVWAAAIGSGLMAGVYFAFSTFIMRAFNTLQPSQAINAMNAINKIILRSIFMPLFFGTTVISLLFIILAIINWNETDAVEMLCAGLVYFIGMFLCTVAFNVPLNNSLSLIPVAEGKQQDWLRYTATWTRWNHIRTLSCIISCVLCIEILIN